jgi:hypothetical protein
MWSLWPTGTSLAGDQGISPAPRQTSRGRTGVRRQNCLTRWTSSQCSSRKPSRSRLSHLALP